SALIAMYHHSHTPPKIPLVHVALSTPSFILRYTDHRDLHSFPTRRSSDLITSSVNSRERSGINTILHELNPLFTINVTMRDIKSKNVYSRVNSKATTQWRKTESANGVHLEGVASDNRSS